MVWSVHMAIHRNPDCWQRPDEFLPERLLVEKDDPLFPAATAPGGASSMTHEIV